MKSISTKQMSDLVVAFVRNAVKANGLGVQIVANFAVNDLKKGTARNRSEAYNRFYNADKGEYDTNKVSHYKNVTLQRNYANAVENRSNNPLPYNVEAPKGREWVKDCEGILLVSTTDPTKFYLRVSMNKNSKVESTYYVGEKEATDEEVAIIKAHLPKKDYACKKQLAYGVDEDNQVKVKDFTLSNIVSIKYGERELKLQ